MLVRRGCTVVSTLTRSGELGLAIADSSATWTLVFSIPSSDYMRRGDGTTFIARVERQSSNPIDPALDLSRWAVSRTKSIPRDPGSKPSRIWRVSARLKGHKVAP
jgi:hypothetical protein